MSNFFFLYQSPLSLLCTVSDSISSIIDDILLIHPSVNMFVFHHKDWLTYSSGTDRLVNSVTIFLSQMILLRWLTFLLISLTVTLMVLLFSIYLFLLTLVFVLQWLFLQWEILIMLLSQFPLTLQKLKTGCPFSLHSLLLFSCWLGWCLWWFERCSIGVYL